MHLFPAIDLRGGRVVRLCQGDYDRQTTYETDPLTQAQRFEQAGATWLHLVDLDGAKSGRLVHREVIARICRRTKLKVEVGGGVRSRETVDQLLNAGVERVILGTAALRDLAWFEQLVHSPALRHRLGLGLDAREGRLALAGWREASDLTALQIARRVSHWPLAAIIYTDIATDGTLRGPNVEAVRRMTETTRVPVVASGGVGSLDHLRALRQLAIAGAIVGRALYENAFTIDEALAVFEHGR